MLLTVDVDHQPPVLETLLRGVPRAVEAGLAGAEPGVVKQEADVVPLFVDGVAQRLHGLVGRDVGGVEHHTLRAHLREHRLDVRHLGLLPLQVRDADLHAELGAVLRNAEADATPARAGGRQRRSIGRWGIELRGPQSCRSAKRGSSRAGRRQRRSIARRGIE